MHPTRRQFLIGSGAAVACGSRPLAALAGTRSIGGTAFGSHWRLTLKDTARIGQVRHAVTAIIESVDAAMSPWRGESELSRFNANRSTDWQPMSAATCTVVAESLAVADLTGGAFDPTVGPLVRRFGFGPIQGTAATPRAISVADGLIRKTAPGQTLDLCGIAKGHALDRIAARLGELGVRSALIDLGGEVRALGAHPDGRAWQVGIEVPGAHPPAIQRIIAPGALAVATSGHAAQGRSGRAGLSHIIDPATGRPADQTLAAVTVLAASAMRADALATGLTGLGADAGPALARRSGIPVIFLVRTHDGLAEVMTGGFADHLIV